MLDEVAHSSSCIVSFVEGALCSYQASAANGSRWFLVCSFRQPYSLSVRPAAHFGGIRFMPFVSSWFPPSAVSSSCINGKSSV